MHTKQPTIFFVAPQWNSHLSIQRYRFGPHWMQKVNMAAVQDLLSIQGKCQGSADVNESKTSRQTLFESLLFNLTVIVLFQIQCLGVQSRHNKNCLDVPIPSGLHQMCLQVFSGIRDCYRCEKPSRYSQRTRWKCMGGDWRWVRSGQYPVARITRGSVNVALVHWATTAFISKLLHVLVCSVSPNCFLEGGRWKGSSVFYIYISTTEETEGADSSVVEVYSEGMDLASLKCHSVNMGFCLVLGHDKRQHLPTL